MENFLKQKKGITLIALVITIIVLLILAGISIQMLTGDNGILQKATEAKENTDLAQRKEELQLAITGASVDYYNGAKTGTLRDYLFSTEGQAKIKSELGTDDVIFNTSKHTITYKGIEFIIAEDGTIKPGIEISKADPENLEPEELPNDFWIASEGTAYINTKYITIPEELLIYGSYSGYYGGEPAIQVGECQYTKLTVPSKINDETVTAFSVANVNNIVLLDIQEGIKDIPDISTIKNSVQKLIIPKNLNITEMQLKQKLTNEFGKENIGYIITNSSDNRFYIAEIKKLIWAQNSEGKIVSPDGKLQLQIGDYINYDPENSEVTTITSYSNDNGLLNRTYNLEDYSGGWRVLGVKNGQVELISENNIGVLSLYGRIGYQNAENELNKVAGLYGHGKYATGARSVNVDDINKITGYNPNAVGIKNPTEEQIANGNKFDENTLSEYGNEITFRWDGTDKPAYTSTNGLTGNLSTSHNDDTDSYKDYKKSFSWFDFNSNIWLKSPYTTTKSYITSIKNTGYWYKINTLIDNNSKEGELLLGKNYYLASKYVDCNSSFVTFGIREVSNSTYETDVYSVTGTTVARSYGFEYQSGGGIRAVVSLAKDIELEENGTNSWKFK